MVNGNGYPFLDSMGNPYVRANWSAYNSSEYQASGGTFFKDMEENLKINLVSTPQSEDRSSTFMDGETWEEMSVSLNIGVVSLHNGALLRKEYIVNKFTGPIRIPFYIVKSVPVAAKTTYGIAAGKAKYSMTARELKRELFSIQFQNTTAAELMPTWLEKQVMGTIEDHFVHAQSMDWEKRTIITIERPENHTNIFHQMMDNKLADNSMIPLTRERLLLLKDYVCCLTWQAIAFSNALAKGDMTPDNPSPILGVGPNGFKDLAGSLLAFGTEPVRRLARQDAGVADTLVLVFAEESVRSSPMLQRNIPYDQLVKHQIQISAVHPDLYEKQARYFRSQNVESASYTIFTSPLKEKYLTCQYNATMVGIPSLLSQDQTYLPITAHMKDDYTTVIVHPLNARDLTFKFDHHSWENATRAWLGNWDDDTADPRRPVNHAIPLQKGEFSIMTTHLPKKSADYVQTLEAQQSSTGYVSFSMNNPNSLYTLRESRDGGDDSSHSDGVLTPNVFTPALLIKNFVGVRPLSICMQNCVWSVRGPLVQKRTGNVWRFDLTAYWAGGMTVLDPRTIQRWPAAFTAENPGNDPEQFKPMIQMVGILGDFSYHSYDTAFPESILEVGHSSLLSGKVKVNQLDHVLPDPYDPLALSGPPMMITRDPHGRERAMNQVFGFLSKTLKIGSSSDEFRVEPYNSIPALTQGFCNGELRTDDSFTGIPHGRYDPTFTQPIATTACYDAYVYTRNQPVVRRTNVGRGCLAQYAAARINTQVTVISSSYKSMYLEVPAEVKSLGEKLQVPGQINMNRIVYNKDTIFTMPSGYTVKA